MTTHDPIAALEVEFHRHDNHPDLTWLDGFKDGIDRAIQLIEDVEPPNIRPIQELVAELRDHEQHCRAWDLDEEFLDFEEEFPDLLDAIDSACLVLETIIQHEHKADYTTAVAEAARALQLKDITNRP
ncbi:MAG: hypothetical protein Q4D89_03825 [Arachnia propionica]|uniref:hypothetical protein n=1 Tax=Arachnia propionica TaxID=1750 RepID=UPI0026FAFF6C|nr:hypothetical protein [Arachnia propionica]